MNKKLILLGLVFLVIILSIGNLISASLCLGEDRYYHDCDDKRYFDNDARDYDDEYYYHGNYYPTRDYYYREYYQPKCQTTKCYTNYYVKDYFKEIEEYKHTIESRYEDRYGYEKIKITVSEKTEVERNYKCPYSWWKRYFE